MQVGDFEPHRLVAMVLHQRSAHGGHFKGFFYCDFVWYEYDRHASGRQYQALGDHAQMLARLSSQSREWTIISALYC
jgi:hypothetical protein